MLHARLNLPGRDEAIPGRDTPLPPSPPHAALGRALHPPYPDGLRCIHFGMGCFWGAERLFWQLPGVYVTAVGYAGGVTRNPTYQEVCTGRTGHAEVVRVVFAPDVLSLRTLLRVFWEHHDPTQGMRQGADVGTQYRSIILCSDEAQREEVEVSMEAYGHALAARGLGPVTTTVAMLVDFYFAEPYHQQYLEKVPDGYCGLGGTGVSCPG